MTADFEATKFNNFVIYKKSGNFGVKLEEIRISLPPYFHLQTFISQELSIHMVRESIQLCKRMAIAI
jgi:hypothetical protein